MHISLDCSSHSPPSLPIPGLCRSIDGSGTREAGLLTPIVLDLFSDDCRHTSLHEPLAGHPCLLIHHLAGHLAREGKSIKRLRFFNQGPLTEQSIAQELLQGTQTLLLIELGHLNEQLEGQSLPQRCPGHQ